VRLLHTWKIGGVKNNILIRIVNRNIWGKNIKKTINCMALNFTFLIINGILNEIFLKEESDYGESIKTG